MKHYINIDSYITLPERLFRLIVDLDEAQIFDMYNESILSSIPVSYNTTGTKTFRVSAFVEPTISTIPIVHVYEDALTVVDLHDNIDTDLYDKRSSTFLLPVTSVPQIYPNDWGVSNVFNNTILQIQSNLDYLIKKTYFYDCTDFHFIGWYGSMPNESLGLVYNIQHALDNVSWQVLQTDGPQPALWEDFNANIDSFCHQWTEFTCVTSYDLDTTNVLTDVVVNVLSPTQLDDNDNNIFTNTRWHVSTPLLSTYLYDDGYGKTHSFIDMFISNNTIFIADVSSINVRVNDVKYTKKDRSVIQLSRNMPFGNIHTLTKGKDNSLVVCDTTNNCIANFIYKEKDIETWGYSFRHQGLGSVKSKYKFNVPSDVCTDLNYRLYVCDSLNNCIKIYSDRGEWVYTLEVNGSPVSVTVDSSNVLHCLIDNQIYRYELVDYSLLDTYTCSNTLTPTRIRSNYSREIVYVCSSDEIIKHFKNGKRHCNVPITLSDISNVYQDEDRNLYIFTKGKVVKYYDPMFITNNTNILAIDYWSRDDIKINKDEYVQDWVYNRAFHRMWDNIELFRSCLKYRYDNSCKSYTAPLYTKEQIFIGQNEIVTSAVINRCLKYLWLNLQTLYKYFNNTCV